MLFNNGKLVLDAQRIAAGNVLRGGTERSTYVAKSLTLHDRTKGACSDVPKL